MKKNWKAVSGVICLSLFAAMSLGSGSTTGSSTPTKVGEVTTVATDEGVSEGEETTNGENETGTVAEETTAEVKEEYHVGDILKDGDMQIVYVASGEYQEDNEFMQPADGNKIIFLKFACENQGTEDEGISSYSFECYADGYNVEAHYTDDDLSATLSQGRSCEGIVAFEVPADAETIEVEYETNFITEQKIKFIYDGDQDSGYVIEANTAAKENAFSVGDVIESDDLNISYLSCEKDTSYSEYFGPEEGYHFVTLTFEFENKGSDDEYISSYDFDCYADGKVCEQEFYRDDDLSATLSTGRKADGSVTFAVPDDASVVEVEYLTNAWTSNRIVFTVSE